MLNSIQISTTNEKILLNNISVKETIVINSNGGDVEFDSLYVGKKINITAKNGNITGSLIGDINEFSISYTIKKGDCNLPINKEDGSKSINADCNNGNINIDFIK